MKISRDLLEDIVDTVGESLGVDTGIINQTTFELAVEALQNLLNHAELAELADASDSKSDGFLNLEGSIPSLGTISEK